MKQLCYISIIFIVTLLSCGDKKELASEDVQQSVKSGEEEETPGKEGEEPIAFAGFDVDCLILFTDSNHVSVYDELGYGWDVSQIQVRYLVDGKELVFMDMFDKEHPPIMENTSGIGMSEICPNWTGVSVYAMLNNTLEPEYTTTLLKFPNNTVDTLYCLVNKLLLEYNGKYVENGLYTAKVWYNGELKFDVENRDLNPEVFFDGQERQDRMFHIVK